MKPACASNCCTTQSLAQCAPFPVAAYVSLPLDQMLNVLPKGSLGLALSAFWGLGSLAMKAMACQALCRDRRVMQRERQRSIRDPDSPHPGFLLAPFCLVTQPLSASFQHLSMQKEPAWPLANSYECPKNEGNRVGVVLILRTHWNMHFYEFKETFLPCNAH